MAKREQVVAFTGREQAELVELEAGGPLGPDEITGRTLASLISPGTELNANYLGENFPAYPGYAAVFEVDEVGAEVSDVMPGEVMFCTGPHGIGGHRSRQRLPRKAGVKVPDGLPAEIAVHARLMGVSMSTLVSTSARPPERVLILGLGPVGNLAAQHFKANGYEVLGVDPVGQRRELAKSKGIEEVYERTPLDDKAKLGDITLAIDCSGHEQAVLDGCRAVRKLGEVVVLGVPWRRRSDVYAHDILHAVYRGYVTLRSGWEWQLPRHGDDFRRGNIFENLAACLRWLAEGRVDAEGLYAKAKPADAQQVYQDLLHGRSEKLSVVFGWQ